MAKGWLVVTSSNAWSRFFFSFLGQGSVCQLVCGLFRVSAVLFRTHRSSLIWISFRRLRGNRRRCIIRLCPRDLLLLARRLRLLVRISRVPEVNFVYSLGCLADFRAEILESFSPVKLSISREIRLVLPLVRMLPSWNCHLSKFCDSEPNHESLLFSFFTSISQVCLNIMRNLNFLLVG